MLKWIAGSVSLLLSAVMICGAVSISVPVKIKDHNDCIAYAKANHSDQASCKYEETLWERGHSDPIAYETLWLALFTWALASVGVIQGLLSYEQIRLAREEFNATHRPHVLIHSVSYHAETILDAIEKQLVGARIIYANDGDMPANIESIKYAFTQQQVPLKSGIGIHKDAKLPRDPIGGGVHGWFDIEYDRDIRTVKMTSDESSRLFLIGTIRYRAANGPLRVMGFCRWAEISPQCDCRWLPYENPEYDYSY